MNVAININSKPWSIALGLAVFTVVYNVFEGLVSLYYGVADEALTLAGFGVDSFIEVISGVGIIAMILRLRQYGSGNRGRFERLALRITGACFYALVAGLVVAALVSVWQNQHPTTTIAGAIISVLSIAIMRVLAAWKIRTGQRLNAPSIIADGNCTMVCVYMSVVLLVSSALYEWFKLPYVDAAGLMGLAWFSYQEGKESFQKAKGVECCGHC